MKPPFTLDQFLKVFEYYNQNVFPLQVIFYLLGIIIIYWVIKPIPPSDKYISLILAFFWLWMGLVYHLIFFTTINKAAYLFGPVFIFQSILFLIQGAYKKKLTFQFRYNVNGIAGMILILFAMVVYPVLSHFLGHVYPVSPTFGLPCPTTIFTLGLLLLNTKKSSWGILIIPFIWSIIGFTAAFQFGMVEDTGLIIAGLLTFLLVLLQKRMLPGNQTS